MFEKKSGGVMHTMREAYVNETTAVHDGEVFKRQQPDYYWYVVPLTLNEL